MFYNDFTKSENISHDWARWPCVRVSSAKVPSVLDGAPFGSWYETWVFSDCPGFRTTQVTFKTEEKCLKAHKHILRNVRHKIDEYNQSLDRTARSHPTKE